jgi:hypothetical protein
VLQNPAHHAHNLSQLDRKLLRLSCFVLESLDLGIQLLIPIGCILVLRLAGGIVRSLALGIHDGAGGSDIAVILGGIVWSQEGTLLSLLPDRARKSAMLDAMLGVVLNDRV